MLRQMLFLFVFILIGLLLGKTGKIDPDHTGVISTLLVYVCTPFVNFRTFARNFTPAYIQRGYLYLIAAAVVIGVLHVFGGWLSRKLTEDPYEQKVWQYSLVVPNFGFMGYPVVGGALGEEALMDFMMFCLPFSLYVYAYSLPVLTRAKPSLRGLLNPPMLAIFGGMAVGLSGLPLPEAVTELIGPAADVLGCFGMILLGAVPLIVFSLGASMLIPAGDYSAFRQIEYSNNDEYEFTVYSDEKNLDHNMEAVSVLNPSIYPTLDEESRKDAVEELECVEANYLGIEPPAIEYADLGESTWGETDYEENTVRINAELLNDKTSENLVETLLHELYHVYTYRCIVLYNKLGKEDRGLLLFRVAEMCAQDFNNYESGEEDFEAYANQACEISARKYAEDGCAEIYERIGEYLEGKE